MQDLKRTRISQNEMDKLTLIEKKERRSEYKRNWNADNKEKVIRMRKENIIKTSVTRKAQIKEHRKNNPLIMFTRNTLVRVMTEKAKQVMINLPYSQDDFKFHIESQFQEGMSWENRSEWHIDHIKPLSLFIKEGIYDLNIINDLDNLKPMWAKDNLEKSSKF